MFERTWQKFNELFSEMELEMSRSFAAFKQSARKRRHRIVSKDGHIVITGEFKSLTVNGKRIEKG